MTLSKKSSRMYTGFGGYKNLFENGDGLLRSLSGLFEGKNFVIINTKMCCVQMNITFSN